MSSGARTEKPREPPTTLASIGLIGTLLIAATGAFVGMGLFMFNMGSDMGTMTKAVTQMGQDVSSMAKDMQLMRQRMGVMAESRVEGQADMTNTMGRMRLDINKFTRPESIMSLFR